MPLDERIISALDLRTADVPSTYRRDTFRVAVAIAEYLVAHPDQPLAHTGRWSVDPGALFKRVAVGGSLDDIDISSVVWDKALSAALTVVGDPR